jgi:4-hydroxy-tetrahydrodipicolinate synthase
MHKDLPARGVFCALATPLHDDGTLDRMAFQAHAGHLLAAGCDGIAPFGTTGEGPSFSVNERQVGLEILIEQGIDARRVIAGTGAAAIGDAIELGRHALSLGVTQLLVLPPFYYKDLSDDGLYAAYARIIDGIGDPRLRLVLYHIPQVTQVPLTAPVIARLLTAYPAMVAGIKDSTGDLEHTLSLIRCFPGLSVFCGAEHHLPAVLQAGGAGTICGLANLVPCLMRRLHDAAGMAGAEASLERITALVEVVVDGPFVPRLKALLAAATGSGAWRNTCPPLSALSAVEAMTLVRAVIAVGSLDDDWPQLRQPALLGEA